MTEQLMNRVEFEEHHSRTWDYVARVGKIWEGIAEEQQAILDGKGYQHLGYSSHEGYWSAEFAENTGWGYSTVEAWMEARRVKLTTPTRVGVAYEPTGYQPWRQMRTLTPDERAEFLERYEPEIKPKLQADGVAHRVFGEAVKEFKGEREATTRNLMTPEEYKNLPSGELTDSERAAFKIRGWYRRLRNLNIEEVAQTIFEEFDSSEVRTEIAEAREVADFFSGLADALQTKLREGLKEVK